MYGSRLVVVGALLGSLFLSFFLYRVTASAAYAPERAQAEAERILREHQEEPLEHYQIKELDALMASAEKELVKQ